MTTMTDEVSRPLLLWAANRTLEMHTEPASESRPWAGRCAACGPDGCKQLAWAVAYQEANLPQIHALRSSTSPSGQTPSPSGRDCRPADTSGWRDNRTVRA